VISVPGGIGSCHLCAKEASHFRFDLFSPQSLNRYGYVLNNPLRYTDPTGHRACDDFDAGGRCVTAPPARGYTSSTVARRTTAASSSTSSSNRRGGTASQSSDRSQRDSGSASSPTDTQTLTTSQATAPGSTPGDSPIDLYVQGWTNVEMAWTIVTSPYASWEDRALAGGYGVVWGGAHVAAAIGAGGLACAASGPGCVTLVEGALGIGGAVSADGDPSNELVTAYNVLRPAIQGTGLQGHHLIEQRFSWLLNTNPRYWPSVGLAPEQHQVLTNLWRNAIGYTGDNRAITTFTVTVDDLVVAVQDIYAEYPVLRDAALQQLE